MTSIDNTPFKTPFTKNIHSPSIGHVLYTYTNINEYLINATSFIAEGLGHHHTILYMDRLEFFEQIKSKLEDIGYSKKQLHGINFIESNKIYEPHADFNPTKVIENMGEIIYPYVKQGNVLRGWGLVTWRPQNESSLKANFVLHEKNVEKVFTEIANVTGDFINVCAYDNLTVSGTLLDELLQSHEFHMTDTTLTRSHLYNKKPILFPQIIEQINVESELINENVRKEKIKTARELAANIAHELYNPLSVIKGRLKLLDEMEDVNDQIQTHLTSIKNTVVKMERVVSEYLSLAKSYGENNNNINILQMMEEVKTYINFDIEVKNIDLTIVSEHKELMINCDVFKMKQVFYHLIKNAIEAMEVGTITLNLKEAGEFIYIDVSDNGPGIPDNILSKIGEPFMSTKENGTGLGLLISEKIIREHNGKLFLNTEVSKGTTITIRLEKAQ